MQLHSSAYRWLHMHMHYMHMHYMHSRRYVLQLGWRVTLPLGATPPSAVPGDACSVTVTVSPAAPAAPAEAVAEGAGEGEAAAAGGVAEERVAESVELLVAGFKSMLAERMAARPLDGDPYAAAERAALHGPLGARRMHLEQTLPPGTAAPTPPQPHARPVYGTVALRLLLADLEQLIAPGQPVWRRRLWLARLRGWLPPLLSQSAAASRRALEIIADPIVGSGWKGGPKAGVAGDAVEGLRPDPQPEDTPIGVPIISVVADWCAACGRTTDAAPPTKATAARCSRRRCAFYWSTIALGTCGRGCSGDDEGGAALQSKTVGLGELMVTMCWLRGARGSNRR